MLRIRKCGHVTTNLCKNGSPRSDLDSRNRTKQRKHFTVFFDFFTDGIFYKTLVFFQILQMLKDHL